MTKNDLAALKLAVDLTLAEKDQGRVEQVQWMLEERDWEEVAEFCAYHRQVEALNLKPWQAPPAHIDIDLDPGSGYRNDREGHELLKQMLKLGISKWHPDPLVAIAAKKVN